MKKLFIIDFDKKTGHEFDAKNKNDIEILEPMLPMILSKTERGVQK